MHWSDQAIILCTSKHGENSGIVTLLASEHGLYKGYVRGLTGKSRGTYQPGNVVEASWRGRLSEHLGNFTCEPIQCNAALLLEDLHKLAALNAICSLLEKTLAEREPHTEIFYFMHGFLDCLKADGPWQTYYILFEIELLKQLGFGLDLSCCAATGINDNLIYVSPKSGRAVSSEAGAPYHDKLLRLPQFLINGLKMPVQHHEIKNGLALSGYFLNKYIFEPHQRKMPSARSRLVELMGKQGS